VNHEYQRRDHRDADGAGDTDQTSNARRPRHVGVETGRDGTGMRRGDNDRNGNSDALARHVDFRTAGRHGLYAT